MADTPNSGEPLGRLLEFKIPKGAETPPGEPFADLLYDVAEWAITDHKTTLDSTKELLLTLERITGQLQAQGVTVNFTPTSKGRTTEEHVRNQLRQIQATHKVLDTALEIATTALESPPDAEERFFDLQKRLREIGRGGG